MNATQLIDLSRLWLLLKLELFKNKRGIVITLAVIFGILFTGLLMKAYFGYKEVYESHEEDYAFTLITGGFIISSLAFKDLGTLLRRHNYLTLPASVLEKFLSMWLLTSVGWIILFSLCYIVYAFIANAAAHLLFSQVTFRAFEPFGNTVISAARSYFVMQGIFLAGAVHFKGYVLPKTILSLLLFAGLSGIIAYFMMADLLHGDYTCSPETCKMLSNSGAHTIWLLAKGFFWWALAPLTWVITYFGLKEQEA